MGEKILITGGAGFVGSHLADELLKAGYRVRVLDNLAAQVHGAGAGRPAYLAREVELVVGDVRDARCVSRCLEDVDAVFHLAASVGVGQSMYQIESYTSVNASGTAVLLEALSKRSPAIRRLVVASSMSIFGEGLYRNLAGQAVTAGERSLAQLKARDWELHDADGTPLMPVPTPETKPAALSSVYAISKYQQERMCLVVGRAYGIPTVALRFFNIYGTRQSLSNPYTGVLAIFASRLLNGQPPLVNEDGFQQRDFVSVLDIVRACRLALEVPAAVGQVFNIGSGAHCTIGEIARRMARVLGRESIAAEITGRYRMGDIRHCFADIALARSLLGYCPQVALEEGLAGMTGWLAAQKPPDRTSEASRELSLHGLAL